MKFYIRPKHFARYRSFKIRDESQGELFKIKGKFLLNMRLLTMKDMNGQILYIAKKQPSLSIYRVYDILNEKGESIAKIQRSFGIFRPKYTVTLDERTLELKGAIHQHTFAIIEEGNELATLRKDTFDFGEAYEVTVLSEKRPLLHLFLTVVIDQLNHERKKFNV